MIRLGRTARPPWAMIFAAGVIAAVLPVTAASAADGDAAADDASDTVSWSVSPADETAPDGRSWVELELEPGQSATEHLAVRNLGDREVTFAVKGADGYFTPTGRFNMLPSSEKSVDAGTWLTVASAVTVPAGGTVVVPFEVEVPSDATPGDHAAGIAASLLSQGSDDGARVAVESRVGFRVMVRVDGEVTPQLGVEASGIYITDWNPFDPGAIMLSTTLTNTGNVRLRADATAENGRSADDADEAAGPTELLPGDVRSHEIRVAGVWPIGIVTVPVTVTRSLVLPDGTEQSLESVVRTVTVWAIPWPQLLVVVGLALIVAALVWRRRRRTRRVEGLIARAREEGRREAHAHA